MSNTEPERRRQTGAAGRDRGLALAVLQRRLGSLPRRCRGAEGGVGRCNTLTYFLLKRLERGAGCGGVGWGVVVIMSPE